MTRLSFAQLQALHDALTDRLFRDEVTVNAYVDEWTQVLTMAGWTEDEWHAEVDERWTIDKRVDKHLGRA